MLRNLRRILESQKEELTSLNLSSLCSRQEEQEIDLNSSLAQVVIGVRRSGKSTLCQKVLLQNGVCFAYVNFDDERLRIAQTDDLDDVIQTLYAIYGNYTHLFLDEVQNVKGWPLFINRLLRQQIRIILTGSNANLLSGELATHLTGRYHQIELYPFSFAEYCIMKQVDMVSQSVKSCGLRDFALTEYLMKGGMPELTISNDSNRHDFIQSLLTAIVEKDVCKRYQVRYKKTLSELANKLLDWFGQEKSYNDITREMHIKSIHTTMNYVSYLGNAYLLRFVPKFSYKSVERHSTQKVYAVDTAFLTDRNDALMTECYGWRLENVIALELARRMNSEYQQLYYIRTRDFEVDFAVVERSKVIELIQVTYDFLNPSQKLYSREVNGLLKGSQLTHCNRMTLIMFAGNEQDIQIDNKVIHCVIASNWLLSHND